MKLTNILFILNPQLEELNPMINSVMQVLKGGIFGLPLIYLRCVYHLTTINPSIFYECNIFFFPNVSRIEWYDRLFNLTYCPYSIEN